MAQVNSQSSKSSIASQVMKSAWAVFKSKGNTESFSTCLKKSWKAIKVKAQMFTGKVHFQFKKADGTIREAWGTLKNGSFTYVSKNSNRKPCYSTVVYFDLVKNAFRSFSIDSFIGVIK